MSMMKNYLIDMVENKAEEASGMLKKLASVTKYTFAELKGHYMDYIMEVIMDGNEIDAEAVMTFTTITLEEDW